MQRCLQLSIDLSLAFGPDAPFHPTEESFMKRQGIMWTAAAVLAAVPTIAYAQDKYVLKSPGGIAFADFRGYEDWAVVSSARTDEVLKVIVANPTIIKAYKAGVAGHG